MENVLNKLIEENKYLTKYGKVADYIPALSNANSDDIGICIMDIKGNVYSSGEYIKKFTIQSISKVIALMLAILDKGKNEVFQRVGMEPTDEPFNSFYKLELHEEGKPSNPMINAGAIVTTSLIEGKGNEKFTRLLNLIRDITGDENISYNKEVYMSEKSTSNRNRAMAYLLKEKGLIEGDVEEVLDVYFKQCSIEINCIHLAKIGTFFANKCRTLNGDTHYPEGIANIIVAIMTTCGMYDFSGQYAVEVGIPSKSGVAGGILGVVPNKYGIGVYGPSLDKYGNSIVGYGILKGLSKELGLSIFA
ncbi:L-glutaminase [Keratinibaculum paraultunense]|uniref:Glutaminase n=1 Tax=Keratinibaculum paraultunense TaxID=1278232 RepID=A0A4R3KXN4_9FIRM|nr:glutaminase A [Keratinibaculum paraultunense]QQY78987.1 glutaminase A [Keratinibaculum paraultunense]TCS90609.1 L-glutaminase [Keratinibaculum paraultunense]